MLGVFWFWGDSCDFHFVWVLRACCLPPDGLVVLVVFVGGLMCGLGWY